MDNHFLKFLFISIIFFSISLFILLFVFTNNKWTIQEILIIIFVSFLNIITISYCLYYIKNSRNNFNNIENNIEFINVELNNVEINNVEFNNVENPPTYDSLENI